MTKELTTTGGDLSPETLDVLISTGDMKALKEKYKI